MPGLLPQQDDNGPLRPCRRRPPRCSVLDGNFREDLYFRLAGYTLTLLPLRERLDDIPLLVDAILRRHEDRTKLHARIDKGALAALRSYPWPGNVRELQSILGRCLIDARDSRFEAGAGIVIDRSLVERAIEEQGLGAQGPGVEDWVGPLLARVTAAERPFSASVQEIEAALIARAIASAPSRAEAARRLGMTPQNLNAKLKTLARAGYRF